jgi:hypothetical protein
MAGPYIRATTGLWTQGEAAFARLAKLPAPEFISRAWSGTEKLVQQEPDEFLQDA